MAVIHDLAIPSATAHVISVHGWEVEFLSDGEIAIEKFLIDGRIFDENEIEVLLREFSN